ncbi:MAG: 30S ribosomal protein S20 [Patescibacteria group bacterium]
MPIIKSAKKQMRSSARKRKMNLDCRKAVKTSLRAANDQPTAETLKAAQKALDKAAGRNTIHRNKAARLKSRLARKLKSA